MQHPTHRVEDNTFESSSSATPVVVGYHRTEHNILLTIDQFRTKIRICELLSTLVDTTELREDAVFQFHSSMLRSKDKTITKYLLLMLKFSITVQILRMMG